MLGEERGSSPSSHVLRQSLPAGYGAPSTLRQSGESIPLRRSFGTAPAEVEHAGIGLLMQQDLAPGGEPEVADGKVFIKSVVPGGPCDRDGIIKAGDHVLAVNSDDCIGLTVAAIREKILGPIGTRVSVTLESATTGEVYERILVRGAVTASTSQTVETMRSQAPALSQSFGNERMVLPVGISTNDAGMARLQRRIAELESSLNQSESENQNLKALLEQERRHGADIVRDVDNLQRNNQGQLAEATAKLNKSEQARRELEAMVSSCQAREEEFHLAFTRAKEQTEAREQFFADVKMQMEDMRVTFERDISHSNAAREEALRGKSIAEEEAAKTQGEVQRMKEAEFGRREHELAVRQMLHESETKLIELRQVEEKVRGMSQATHLLFGQWHKDYFHNKSPQEQELESYFLS